MESIGAMRAWIPSWEETCQTVTAGAGNLWSKVPSVGVDAGGLLAKVAFVFQRGVRRVCHSPWRTAIIVTVVAVIALSEMGVSAEQPLIGVLSEEEVLAAKQPLIGMRFVMPYHMAKPYVDDSGRYHT